MAAPTDPREVCTREELDQLLARGFRYALSLTHDEARAEDLLQDAWVAVLRARGPRHAGYLFAAIRSRFIDHRRRDQLVVMDSLDGDDATATEAEARSAMGPVEPVFADPRALEQALGTLRPPEREVLFLAAVEQHTAQEIADLTGRPRGTVLSLIHRARRKLARVLEPAREEMSS